LSRRISLFDHRFVTTVFQAATVSELLHLQAKTDWLHSAGARIQERDGGVYAASTWKDQTFFGFCNAGNEFEP